MTIIAAMAGVTIALAGGQQAHANAPDDATAGETITKGATPTTLETPSAAPPVTATPYGEE